MIFILFVTLLLNNWTYLGNTKIGPYFPAVYVMAGNEWDYDESFSTKEIYVKVEGTQEHYYYLMECSCNTGFVRFKSFLKPKRYIFNPSDLNKLNYSNWKVVTQNSLAGKIFEKTCKNGSISTRKND